MSMVSSSCVFQDGADAGLWAHCLRLSEAVPALLVHFMVQQPRHGSCVCITFTKQQLNTSRCSVQQLLCALPADSVGLSALRCVWCLMQD